MQLTFMCVFKYFDQRVIRIDGKNGLSFKGVLSKKKKKYEEIEYSRLSFYYCLPVLEKCLEKCLKMNVLIQFLSLFLFSSETDENSPFSDVTLKTWMVHLNG